jgi:hypothetical protein
MIGKDFFSRKSKSDFFETPYSMTEQLLESEKFDYSKKIIDGSAGNGAITGVLHSYFNSKTVEYYDIYNPDCNVEYYDNRYNPDCYNQGDFLTENKKFPYSIQNPPFSLWDDFIKKSKIIITEKFAFLGRFEFLTGLKRFNENIYFDPEYPLTKIYLFVRKVNLSFSDEYSCLRTDGKYPAGMYHYAWFIFEKMNEMSKNILPGHIPIIKMINNNPYILRKSNEN